MKPKMASNEKELDELDTMDTGTAETSKKKRFKPQKAKRTTWEPAEEKQFLVICIESAIADQLDQCVTSAGVSSPARACTFLIFEHRLVMQMCNKCVTIHI